MQTSEQIHEIAAALAKAQGVIRNPAKDKTNPHFKSSYADLASGLEVIRPALSGVGIAVLQVTDLTDDGVILKTRLVHSSGQWIEGSYPVSKFAPHQQMGAALTYAKRQALFAMVGVCGTDDDADGNDTADVDTKTQAPAKPAAPAALTAKESNKLCQTMLMALDHAETTERLQAWKETNRENAMRLTKDDKQALSRAVERKALELADDRPEMIAAE